MIRSTLEHLACPNKKGKCLGGLTLSTAEKGEDVLFGTIECGGCRAKFPILAGVAILVPNIREYLLSHVKGISKFVPDEKIPKEYRKEYLEYKSEIDTSNLEEDLESERVNSLYLMNHYLNVKNSKIEWWKPITGDGSPLMQELIQKYWDQSPLSKVAEWIPERKSVIELGCGVGGLYHRVSNKVKSYLGVDNAFHSIILARHLNLGSPYSEKLEIPGDLLAGAVSRDVSALVKNSQKKMGSVDFVVGEMESLPIRKDHWDVSVSLNVIDMLDDPRILADAQNRAIRKEGVAIQTCPYIWNSPVSKRMRAILPPKITDSARAVEWLYEKAGFQIERHEDHVPWLFFKHLRQIEFYSVHAFIAQKK